MKMTNKEWSTFVNKTQKGYIAMARKIVNTAEDAEDVVQTVYMKLFRANYNEKGMLSAGVLAVHRESFNVVRNKHKVQALNNPSKMPTYHQYKYVNSAHSGYDGLHRMDSDVVFDSLSSILTSSEHKIITAYGVGFSYLEISEMYNIALGTVKAVIARARKKLHKVYPDLFVY